MSDKYDQQFIETNEVIRFVREWCDFTVFEELEPMATVKPTHGTCCTCQTCGHANDGDCVCGHNEFIEWLKGNSR